MILKWVDNTKNILYIYYIYIRYVCMLLTFDKICQELQFFLKNGSVDESIILVKGPLSGLEQFWQLKVLYKYENRFFMLKALFVLRYFHFCPEFLVIKKSGSIKKLRLISKLMTSQAGLQTITINIMSNIS